jgi:hypothetical protein
MFRLHVTGQEVDFVLDQTESEYARVKQFAVATPSTDPVDHLAKDLEGLNVDTGSPRWNTERKEKYRAASAKVLYLIMICISPLDEAFIKARTNYTA